MAFGSDRTANFVVKAKDAATGPLGKVGGAMGKLKSASVTAFAAIGDVQRQILKRPRIVFPAVTK